MTKRKRATTKRQTPQKPTISRGHARAWRKTFLSVLGATSNVTAAAAAAHVDRKVVYMLRKSDPTFAEEWADALERAGDVLEAAAWKRGVKGVKRVVHSAGKVVGYEIEYSDSLLQMLLKGHKPERYGDKLIVEIKQALPVLNEIAELLRAENVDFSEAQRQFLEMLKAQKAAANIERSEDAA